MISPVRWIRWFCLCCVTVFFAVGCGLIASPPQLSPDPLSIAYSPWPGYYPLTIHCISPPGFTVISLPPMA